MITYEEASEAFEYDPDTGIITNKTNRGKARKGEEAGWETEKGYRRVHLLDRNYMIHRLAWLLHHGEWPKQDIDHINGVKDDNRIRNLRDVSRLENKRNSKKSVNNTSGVTGVKWHKRGRKWTASIKNLSEDIYLGLFDCFLDAIAARLRAEKEFNFHENHGRSI